MLTMAPPLLAVVKRCIDNMCQNNTQQTTDNFINETQVDSFLDYGNGDFFNGTENISFPVNEDDIKKITEFHIIKAIVLSIVTLVILLSICKMVFGMSLRYPEGKD